MLTTPQTVDRAAGPCPVCQGGTFSRWGRVDDFNILQCQGCGLGLTDPVPTSEQLEAVNREIYTLDRRIATYLPPKKQRQFERRYRETLARLMEFKPTGRLLDVGCNIGLFLKVAREAGYQVTGVELNRECAEFGSKHFGVTIRSEYLEDAASELGRFDVITLFDVLEHIPDMQGFLAAVKGVLEEDGILVVQLPNLGSLMAKIARSRWGWLTPPDHLYHFTPDSLCRFLEQNGFEVAMLRTWEPAKEFTGALISALCPLGPVGKLIYRIVRATRVVLVPVLCLQRIWWQRKAGGLIELYAVNRSGGGKQVT